ncbi:MAG: MBL fold metallo-hydrolase [Myxococcales bacterium]|nr:MBL fold metallo-hydrolase [Myxococcales bacterium]
MARRQEQEAARSEVSEVAPDVLRMELPIRMPGLGHVNCYAILDREGATVVDPGMPGPATWKAIQERLKQAGLAPRHVHTVVITHSHPDHFGCAMRFAKESGAKIVAHHKFSFGPPQAAEPEVSADDLAADPRHASHGHAHANEPEGADADESADAREARVEQATRFVAAGQTPWGGERPRPPLRIKLKWMALRWLGQSIVPVVTDPVEHGDVLMLANREWFVFHTPGHTQDHFCLHDPESGIFLAGDHVLPTITPHISGISSSPDPLATFFYSLDRVGEIDDVEQVLPAHGHPFHDLRARCEAIKRHHDERLDKVKEIGRELGPAAVSEFSKRLFKPRSWGAMAESETYAHLEHLRVAGDAAARRGPDGKLIYETG